MKTFVYRVYFFYRKKFPLQRGKTFIGKAIYKWIGNSVFLVKDVKLELNPLSLIDRMIIENGSYEDDIFREIESNLNTGGGIFLDIGANFGLFTVQAAKLPNVYVFSFEPSKRELLRLYRNITLNKLTNVTVFPFGLGEKNYTAELNISDDSNQSMNSLVNSFSNAETQKIDCFALDNLLHSSLIERVRIIKMDVEGFEYNVLLGMNMLLESYNGPIILEVTYYLENKGIKNYNPDNIYDFLLTKGFKPKYGKRHAAQYNDFFYKN